jgi:hypothetical protein
MKSNNSLRRDKKAESRFQTAAYMHASSSRLSSPLPPASTSASSTAKPRHTGPPSPTALPDVPLDPIRRPRPYLPVQVRGGDAPAASPTPQPKPVSQSASQLALRLASSVGEGVQEGMSACGGADRRHMRCENLHIYQAPWTSSPSSSPYHMSLPSRQTCI